MQTMRNTAVIAVLASLAASPVAADPLVFTDVAGEEVTLSGPAKRIVTLPQPAAATFIALDQGIDKIVGMNPGSKKALEGGILGEIFPAAKAIESNILAEGGGGWMPNVEAVAALNPDVVIQWGRRSDDLIAPLRNANIPVALMVGGGNAGTEELARQNLLLAANVLGNQDRIDELFSWRDEVIEEINKGVATIPQDKRLSVLHLRSSKNKFMATGEKSYQNYYIVLTGGRNVGDGTGVQTEVNAEQIAAWNPDVILLTAHEQDAGVETIYDDPILSQTSAGVNRKVYKTPIGGYVWDSASHESPFTWMWLANVLYPDVFNFDLRSKLKDRYQFLYGYEPNDSQIDAILRVKMNGVSENYAQFSKK